MSVTNQPQVVSPSRGIDPRAPQFNAVITLIILIAALATLESGFGLALVVIQTALFLAGAIAGVSKIPHAWVFRTLIRPRLAAPDHLESPQPPRFAQAVGAVFGLVALAGLLLDSQAVAVTALGFAVVAATLNAFFRFCLGCELFLLLKRTPLAR